MEVTSEAFGLDANFSSCRTRFTSIGSLGCRAFSSPLTNGWKGFELCCRSGIKAVHASQEAVPTVEPSRVVQPDSVCEVGGSTPGLSHGDLGIFLGGGQTEEFVQ